MIVQLGFALQMRSSLFVFLLLSRCWGGTIQMWRSSSITWPCSVRTRASTRRWSTTTYEPWRSTNPNWERTTPTWPRPKTTWWELNSPDTLCSTRPLSRLYLHDQHVFLFILYTVSISPDLGVCPECGHTDACCFSLGHLLPEAGEVQRC